MKRFLGFAFAMFFALVGIALVGGDSGAVAGHGCHGRCHGGALARLHRCHGERERCHGGLARHRRGGCHGNKAASACETAASSDCGSCGGEAVVSSDSGCGSCGSEAVMSSDGGCGSCGGEVAVSSAGGCVGGACGGESVISEGAVEQAVPTESAPVEAPTPAAPKAPEAPAAPKAT